MGEDTQYPDHFVRRLHTIWGEGFLSPGGPEEVKEIVRGIDLSDRILLDVGCGTGGPAIVLARELGVRRVVAIDVEPKLLESAAGYAKTVGVRDKIEFNLVEPGPFPFEDNTFDVAFSKDALIHIVDKSAMYRELLRVLRPGGVFVASDWLGGDNTETAPEWRLFRDLVHLDFTMATASETEAVMIAAGFTDVSTRDRNAWFSELSRYEADQIAGPLRKQLIADFGEEIYQHWLRVRLALADAAAIGALRPTHLRGYKAGSRTVGI